MHEALVRRLGGLNLPRKSVVRLSDRPTRIIAVYRGRKITTQQQPSGQMESQTLWQQVNIYLCSIIIEM